MYGAFDALLLARLYFSLYQIRHILVKKIPIKLKTQVFMKGLFGSIPLKVHLACMTTEVLRVSNHSF